jgi:predicted dienelactone hydrolase
MSSKYLFLILLFFSVSKAFAFKRTFQLQTVKRDTITWFDNSRNRPVPVAIYTPGKPKTAEKQQVVILSPGYPGKHTDYGYIAENLAKNGCQGITSASRHRGS